MIASKSNQKGFMTVEFLFAIAIAFSLTMLTFALTFTLSTIESYQYIIFSASRAHLAANYDVDAQKKAAQKKYEQLLADPALGSLFKNGWFEVSKPAQLDIRSGNGDNFEKDYAATDNKQDVQGVRGNFKAVILEMNLPLLGKVSPENDGFTTRVNAIMLREVSQKECYQFMKDRTQALWDIGGSRFAKFKNPSANVAVPWEDNGC